MNGELSEHPLVELIREITTARLSGSLRLERQRVKLAIYFDQGELLYAVSNLRAHRLVEILKRNGINEPGQFGAISADDELAATMLQRGAISAATLEKIRVSQVEDVLKTALLWTDGSWDFDHRVRLSQDIRAVPKLDGLLMESARRLPPEFVAARMDQAEATFSRPAEHAALIGSGMTTAPLLPVEAFILSRVDTPLTLNELIAVSGVPETDTLRSVYALTLGGLLAYSKWPSAIPANGAVAAVPRKTTKKDKPAAASKTTPRAAGQAEIDGDVNTFLDRVERARDHFEVLGLGRTAEIGDVKRVYHALARNFHPDRFHQSEAGLKSRLESAFARIAQAYDTLMDPTLRAAYEAKMGAAAAIGTKSANDPVERIFQQGVAALQQDRLETAVRCLAQVARDAPREGRYRAYYGKALAADPKTRRMAESEFLVALSIEPNNAAFRLMLAELYVDLSLPRRAQSELERALTADPKNQKAKDMLANLRARR